MRGFVSTAVAAIVISIRIIKAAYLLLHKEGIETRWCYVRSGLYSKLVVIRYDLSLVWKKTEMEGLMSSDRIARGELR